VNRLANAELLKLRKRRPLFWWTLVLTVGVVSVVYAIIAILHLSDPAHHDPAGGINGFQGSAIGLTLAGSVAAIMVGAASGTLDVSSGVFRDLVATGRSRWELFAARVPGSLALFLPMITLGYIVITVCSLGLAGGTPTPDAGLIARGFGWVVLATGFDLLIALGLSSFIGSRATAIGVLIGWQFIAAPLLSQVTFLGPVRQALFGGALDRLAPRVITADNGPLLVHSAAIAAIVLACWLAVLLGAGAWRTATRDA
jgi:hypothetical protein